MPKEDTDTHIVLAQDDKGKMWETSSPIEKQKPNKVWFGFNETEIVGNNKKMHLVDGAHVEYVEEGHKFVVNLAKLRVVTKKTQSIVVSFWEAIVKMSNTALGRFFIASAGIILLGGAVVLGVVVPGAEIWAGTLSVLQIVGWALVTIVLVVILSTLPPASALGLLWLVTPRKPSQEVESVKINAIEPKLGWGGLRLDVERSAKETHANLLTQMKKITFLGNAGLIAGITLTLQFFGYFALGAWYSHAENVNPVILIPIIISATVPLLAFIASMDTYSGNNPLFYSVDDRISKIVMKQLVLHFDSAETKGNK